MRILILGEQRQAEVKASVFNTIAAAQQFSAWDQVTTDVLLVGSQAREAAEILRQTQGITEILVAEDSVYDHYLAENIAALLADIGKDYQVIMAAADSVGKDVLPRVAALLDVNMITDMLAVESVDRFRRPIYAGSLIATVESTDAIKLISVRTTAFDPVATKGGQAGIRQLNLVYDSGLSCFVSEENHGSERPELTTAKVVVGGGRGLGSAENFVLIEQLADKLKAAVGASRAAVDAGYVPNELQIGQTGKVIAPDLYLAIGISGAVQHLAGIKDSKLIVAINKDEEAPIFQVADYGLVADLFEVVPELIDKLDDTVQKTVLLK